MILKVGTHSALVTVILLSQGSPSQLTLLVNVVFCSQEYKPIARFFVVGFFFARSLASYQSR